MNELLYAVRGHVATLTFNRPERMNTITMQMLDALSSRLLEADANPDVRVIVLTGLALLLLWIPLRQRPGIGTILNALEIGTVADIALRIIPEPASLPIRGAMVVAGILCVAIGSALYIGSGLGPGPRDGLMTGLAARGIPVRVARTGIEVTVLVVGWLLGGRVGVGTVVFALTIGPLVQWWLPRLAFSSGSARA